MRLSSSCGLHGDVRNSSIVQSARQNSVFNRLYLRPWVFSAPWLNFAVRGTAFCFMWQSLLNLVQIHTFCPRRFSLKMLYPLSSVHIQLACAYQQVSEALPWRKWSRQPLSCGGPRSSSRTFRDQLTMSVSTLRKIQTFGKENPAVPILQGYQAVVKHAGSSGRPRWIWRGRFRS